MIKVKLGNIKKDKHLFELLKGSLASFLFKIVGMVLGYVVMFVVTNRYGAEVYGVLSLSIAVLSIAVLIGKAGIDTAITRFVAENATKREDKSIFLLFIKSSLLVCLFSVIVTLYLFNFSGFIAKNIFNKSYLEEGFRIISLCIFPTAFLAIIANIFQGLKRIKTYSLITNIILNALFVILLVMFAQEKNVVKLYFYASLGAFSISMCILVVMFYRTGIDLKSRVFSFKKILNVSLPMMFASAFTMLMSWTDIMMLGSMKSEVDVGIYAVVVKLASITGIALMAINTISAPKFAEFKVQKDLKALERIVKQSTKIIFHISLPILLVFLFFPKYILSMFGEKFVNGSSALIVLSLGQLINSLCGSVGVIMQMTGMQNSYQKVMLLAVITNVIFNYLLIPVYGIYGASIASMLSLVSCNILMVLLIRIRLRIVTVYLPFVNSRI